jgi:hypothetical protein
LGEGRPLPALLCDIYSPVKSGKPSQSPSRLTKSSRTQ